MNVALASEYSVQQRRFAMACGLACHSCFVLGVTPMIVGLYTGMSDGFGPFHGAAAVAANFLLLAQFSVVHSLLLSKKGRALLARLAPLGLGAALGTTTFAMIAS